MSIVSIAAFNAIFLSMEVGDRQQLEYTLNQIKNMSDVLNIRRVHEIE